MNDTTALVKPQKIIRDRELDDETLAELIDKNVLERNEYLWKFIDALSPMEGGTFTSLDGGWGSGKTVFVKQLDYLNRTKDENTNAIPRKTLEQFQENYATFYYNAWANDDQEPLQSLLFNLLKEASKEEDAKHIKDRFKKGAYISRKVLLDIFGNTTKTLTCGLIDIDKIAATMKEKTASETQEEEQKIKLTKLIGESVTISERKEAVSSIIGDILPDGKRLLFIVDELDRCAPSFAVRLLEAIKHYCLDSRIVFLIVTNNSQLAHTVKKFYGQEFDGMGYLDKFYDMRFRLPDPDAEAYIAHQLQKPWINKEDHFVTIVIKSIVQRLFMPSLREINRYCTMLDHLQKYLESSQRPDGPHRSLYSLLVRYFFGPLALALAIKDMEGYGAFISQAKDPAFSKNSWKRQEKLAGTATTLTSYADFSNTSNGMTLRSKK